MWASHPNFREMNAVDFFTRLYADGGRDSLLQDCLVSKLSMAINEDDNRQLLAPISTDEVHKDVFAMGAYKTPGLDGFFLTFFQDFWDIVSYDVTKVVQDFFKMGRLLKKINNTFIVLIPKTTTPSYLKEYWPISLYNTIYKILSKVLVNRIKPFLEKFISPWIGANCQV
ncbi:hypothetical protein SUGI_1034580 [Cryptomeria japonica]|nr:hypothetical protein SUGI_1034580 [Cryptomeria japonica]